MSLRDFIATNTSFDQSISIITGIAAGVAGNVVFSGSVESAVAILQGISALSGLVLAAATFVCTMTYSSPSKYMKIVRSQFSTVLQRNWFAILGSCLIAALLPLLAILFIHEASEVAIGLGTYSVIILVCSFLRAMYWLKTTLFMDLQSDLTPNPYIVQPSTVTSHSNNAEDHTRSRVAA